MPTPIVGRSARRDFCRRRDLAFLATVRQRLGRMPSRRECEQEGIWFGPRCLWPSYRDLVAAMGETPSDGRLYRYAKPGRQPRSERAKRRAREHPATAVRVCHACLQKTTWAETCAHCGTPWHRTAA